MCASGALGRRSSFPKCQPRVMCPFLGEQGAREGMVMVVSDESLEMGWLLTRLTHPEGLSYMTLPSRGFLRPVPQAPTSRPSSEFSRHSAWPLSAPMPLGWSQMATFLSHPLGQEPIEFGNVVWFAHHRALSPVDTHKYLPDEVRSVWILYERLT